MTIHYFDKERSFEFFLALEVTIMEIVAFGNNLPILMLKVETLLTVKVKKGKCLNAINQKACRLAEISRKLHSI